MKCFKHNLIRVCSSLALLILLFSLGTVTNVSSARRIHRYHVRTSRRVKYYRKHRGTIRFRKHRVNKRSWRLTNRQVLRNCSEIDRQTIKAVNQDRHQNRLPRLRLDHRLSRIGNQRSHQLQSYFSHNTKQHIDEVQYLLGRKNIQYKYYGENIASSPLGKITMLDVGPYDTPTDANPHRLIYHAKNGYQLANNINNASMYHDAGDDNGHRANDLDRQFKRMGVGVSYDHYDKNFYIAIEFIG